MWVLSRGRYPHPLTPASSFPDKKVTMIILMVPHGSRGGGHTLPSSYSLVKEMSPCTTGEAVKGQGWLCPSPAPVDLVAPPEVREPNTEPRSLDSSCQGLPIPAQRTLSPHTQGM